MHDYLDPTTVTGSGLIAREFPPRRHVIDPWLRTGETAVVWAPSGVGKTMLCLSVALAVAGGGAVGPWSCPQPRRVLLVDGEMHLQDVRDRLDVLVGTGAVALPDVAAATENLVVLARQDQEVGAAFVDVTARGSGEALVKLARRHRADLLILDNLSTLSDGLEDENSATAFTPVQSAMMELKRAGVSVILVHHSNKSAKQMRGSTALETTFEVVIGLQRPKLAAVGHAQFDLSFGKFRAKADERIADRTWRLSDEGWIVCDSEPSEGEEDKVVVAVRSLRFVSQNEIAEFLGLSKGTVSKRLAIADKTGLLSRKAVSECFGKARELRDAGPEDDLDGLVEIHGLGSDEELDEAF